MAQQRYQSVNGAWPAPASQLPKLTAQEATSAARKLWRLVVKRRLGAEIQITSGNRRNRMGFGFFELTLNPANGWHSLVHSLSHYVTWKLHPGIKPHDDLGRHAFIERTMIQHVVNSGWLDGKLKRSEKKKTVIDVKQLRRNRVMAHIKTWEAKRARAERALRKLKRQAIYYDRVSA